MEQGAFILLGVLGIVILPITLLSALNGLWLPLAICGLGVLLYGIAYVKRHQ